MQPLYPVSQPESGDTLTLGDFFFGLRPFRFDVVWSHYGFSLPGYSLTAFNDATLAKSRLTHIRFLYCTWATMSAQPGQGLS